ncbi:trypsin-like serine peptidase [Kitasatospora brasiliensis]|uniref:trypsin-like serine peptidase n=1 Tax=Kitasatospora brasiliensis TaxID=3058040 RepID=UPI00292DDEA3|nr:trypsin-like peptidase domain-containing protein [Kitasatospora sp. K002]
MGKHRRQRSRRRGLLVPSLFTALSAVAVAAVLTGTHGLDLSDASAAGKAARSTRTVAAPPAAATGPAAPPTAAAAPTASPAASASPAPTDSPTATASAAATPVTLGTTAPAPAPAADRESATVGALFSGSVGAGNHFCTASVLHSAAGNLLLTAAHCLSSTDGVTFAPGYRDGSAPYGTWRVTAIHTTAGWSQKGDADEDFAILETAPNGGRNVEDVVGGNKLGAGEPFGATVRLYGYPADSEAPLLCTDTTGRESDYQRVVQCPSYPSGTSGGPWIDTATGEVVGAIGGYEQGGDTDDTSYSAYFDHTIADLYTQVEASAS